MAPTGVEIVVAPEGTNGCDTTIVGTVVYVKTNVSVGFRVSVVIPVVLNVPTDTPPIVADTPVPPVKYTTSGVRFAFVYVQGEAPTVGALPNVQAAPAAFVPTFKFCHIP